MANEQSSNESSHTARDQSANPRHDNASNNSSNNVGESAASAPAGTQTTTAASTVDNTPPTTAPTTVNNSANNVTVRSTNGQVAGQERSTSVRRTSLNNRRTQVEVLAALEAAYANGFLSDSDLRLEDDSSDDERGF